MVVKFANKIKENGYSLKRKSLDILKTSELLSNLYNQK